MPNEQSEWVHQVVGYIYSPASFIQRDISTPYKNPQSFHSKISAKKSEVALKSASFHFFFKKIVDFREFFSQNFLPALALFVGQL